MKLRALLWSLLWSLAALLAGCGAPLQPRNFAAPPAFDPVAFFTGHVTSWGVEENRAGQPVAIITTDCHGTPDGPDRITMVQVLRIGGGATQTRTWHLRRAGPGAYVASANDMDGATTGTVGGRALHWRWQLETTPGNRWTDVTMDQWMYRMDDGAVLIRTVVSKAGIRLMQVSEQGAQS